MSEPNRNEYLEQVKAQQVQLETDLKVRPSAPSSMAMPRRARAQLMEAAPAAGGATAHDLGVRVRGFWRWKTVLVPPNVYVVHTRRGRKDPVTLGIGVSFRFDPYTDTFLIVPATMQTILISAACICREFQGLFVQGYVQWIIDDFAVACRKLDFSDPSDPMRLVNLQLREQAEAAIKDKVATMSITEVLSDKQPIIRELTARLGQVAEGDGKTDQGLGLRIVTVQIKEAIVSSARLWENLQKPFRSSQSRDARLAELADDATVKGRELEHEKSSTAARLETDATLAVLRSAKEAESFDRVQAERLRRARIEQDSLREEAQNQHETDQQAAALVRARQESALLDEQALALARERAEHEKTLEELRLRVERQTRKLETLAPQAELHRKRQELHDQLEMETLRAALLREEERAQSEYRSTESRNNLANRQAQAETEIEDARSRVRNSFSDAQLQARCLEILPSVAAALPKPVELRSVQIGGDDTSSVGALSRLMAEILTIGKVIREEPAPKVSTSDSSKT